MSEHNPTSRGEAAEPVLPHDVKVNSVIFRKGVALQTFIAAATGWHSAASKAYAATHHPEAGAPSRARAWDDALKMYVYPDTAGPPDKAVLGELTPDELTKLADDVDNNRHLNERQREHLLALLSERPAAEGWSCAARKQPNGPGTPADCDWPVCGCDPAANKVIEALEESGVLPLPAPPALPQDVEGGERG